MQKRFIFLSSFNPPEIGVGNFLANFSSVHLIVRSILFFALMFFLCGINTTQAQNVKTPEQVPEQARKFISGPRAVSVSPSSPAKIAMVSEEKVKSTIENKIKNKEITKGSMSVRTTADAKDNVASVERSKQQKVANGKNKLNCKKEGQNLKCSFSDKETVVPVTGNQQSPPFVPQVSSPLNIDGRNQPPLASPK